MNKPKKSPDFPELKGWIPTWRCCQEKQAASGVSDWAALPHVPQVVHDGRCDAKLHCHIMRSDFSLPTLQDYFQKRKKKSVLC